MKKYTRLILILIISLLLSACGKKVDDAVLMAAHKAYDNRDAMIIDVRTQQEYQARHVPGARNYPLQSLKKDMHKLPKNKQLILYCRSGNRSATAASYLRHQGFTVFDVATQSEWERGAKLKNQSLVDSQ